MVKSIFFLLAFFALAYVVVGAEEVPGDSDVAADPINISEIPDFAVMKIRDLKAFIARKGTECVACSSKTDLIERAEEVKEWPDKIEEKPKEPSKEELDELLKNLGSDKGRMDKLRAELEKAGLDMSKFGGGKDGAGPKIFSAEDLADFVKKNPPPGAKEDGTEKKEETAGEGKETEEKAEL